MYILISAKNEDDLCNTSYCEYFGPFADYDQASEFSGMPSYTDIAQGRDGRWFWIVKLNKPEV